MITRECTKDFKCAGYVFRHSNGNCYLKGQRSGAIGFVALNGFTSGTKGPGESLPPGY